ncbi:MAG: hypothetical protein KIS62_00730 [Ramlibacter sp.]|nr:hypothetical protein [Ramlibacter sp.]
MPYSVTLLSSVQGADTSSAAVGMFQGMLERELGSVEQAYRDWLDANNAALLCGVDELPSQAQFAIRRWMVAYTQARLISLAAYPTPDAWFSFQIDRD